MDESEENMSAEDSQSADSSLSVKIKPKKRSLVERELETNLTARVTSPVTSEGSSTSRYGRARRLKGVEGDSDKSGTKSLTSTPKVQPTYKMHASNSPIRKESPKRAVSIGSSIEDQIENIYSENISLSRFSDEQSLSQSPAKKFSKFYMRTDLIQKPDDTSIIKSMFSPNKSNSHLNNILERSSEKYSLNSHKSNGFSDTLSVVKTLDFDGKKKKKDTKEKVASKSEIFDLEASCEYQVGDLAWARVGTYPFWPCIVTREPLSDMFVRKKLFGRVEHNVVHVTFFGDNGRRGWIVDNMLRKYSGRSEFESARDKFTPEAKKKDPRLYAAFFVSDKKLPLWNISVDEAETFMREPKRLRIDILYDMLEKARGTKTTPKREKSGKITRTDSDVSLSESLYDTLFSEDDGKTDESNRSKKSRNKSLDVSEVVTACLDNMAAKSGITKIQRQSHMDRWLQKAKSKTPEKSQPKIQVKLEKEKRRKERSLKKKAKENQKSKLGKNDAHNLLSFQNEHDYSTVNYENHNESSAITDLDDSSYDDTVRGDGIGIIFKVESLSGSAGDNDNTSTLNSDNDIAELESGDNLTRTVNVKELSNQVKGISPKLDNSKSNLDNVVTEPIMVDNHEKSDITLNLDALNENSNETNKAIKDDSRVSCNGMDVDVDETDNLNKVLEEPIVADKNPRNELLNNSTEAISKPEKSPTHKPKLSLNRNHKNSLSQCQSELKVVIAKIPDAVLSTKLDLNQITDSKPSAEVPNGTQDSPTNNKTKLTLRRSRHKLTNQSLNPCNSFDIALNVNGQHATDNESRLSKDPNVLEEGTNKNNSSIILRRNKNKVANQSSVQNKLDDFNVNDCIKINDSKDNNTVVIPVKIVESPNNNKTKITLRKSRSKIVSPSLVEKEEKITSTSLANETDCAKMDVDEYQVNNEKEVEIELKPEVQSRMDILQACDSESHKNKEATKIIEDISETPNKDEDKKENLEVVISDERYLFERTLSQDYDEFEPEKVDADSENIEKLPLPVKEVDEVDSRDTNEIAVKASDVEVNKINTNVKEVAETIEANGVAEGKTSKEVSTDVLSAVPVTEDSCTSKNQAIVPNIVLDNANGEVQKDGSEVGSLCETLESGNEIDGSLNKQNLIDTAKETEKKRNEASTPEDQNACMKNEDHEEIKLPKEDDQAIKENTPSVNGFIVSKESSPERKLNEEFDADTVSVKSEDSGVSISKRRTRKGQDTGGDSKITVKKAMEEPDFVKYLELRQDALIDEHPELTQDEIVTYLYQTWVYEESLKSDRKKTDDVEQSNLVKGLNQEPAPQPKKIRKKIDKIKVEKEPNVDIRDLIRKEKPKRKSTQVQPYYNEELLDDSDDDSEIFGIFGKKNKEGNEEGEAEIDEVELYFEELTKPKPNVFKGFVRERVCEICEKTGNLVKCKACHGTFHVDCVQKMEEVVEVPLPTRGRKKKGKRGRKPKGYDEMLDSESQSDDRSQDANVSEENMSIEEDPESRITVDADKFETEWEAKMKELENAEIEYESDQEINWDVEPGNCEVIELKTKEKKLDVDYSDFKCNSCTKQEIPVCFVCKSAVSPKSGVEVRQKCQVAHCHRYYHLECLDHWPQTQFNSWEPSKTNKKVIEYIEALTCPRHVCHTCVSDDPRGCKTRFSGDKLARCVRCPATYHSFTRCLPAGTQILSGSQIICPRHYEHRPGKVPCHVNTGWCFICALGGTLICCEYCPTSFHAECLNIKPPEGSYMCEDCETGRLPLYGEMVWVKLGHYRWWPGIVLHPCEIPDNIMAVKHSPGEFVVRFFGQYDHYWVNRGRVFPFQEGDSGKISSQKSKIDAAFTTAMEHAQRACELLKNVERNSEEESDIASSLLPPHYVKLRVNKPVGSLSARRDDDANSLTQCDCDPTKPDPCGPYSHCLNRMLLTECGPTCRAGERCNNRAFERRRYPRLAPHRAHTRGWGLKTLEDIKQGQFVIEYVGELIDEEEFRRRMCRKHEVRDENYYFLTLDKERMIDAGPKGNLARFMNHCCEPNCETQKWTVLGDVRVGLFALKDIPANSEVTFNYNLQCAGIEKKRCLCGAKRCSGYIGAKPKQEEAQPKKVKLPAKRTYKKRKNVEDSPSTSKPKPKTKITKPVKPRELTEIEKDLLIIKNATNGISSDSEGSARLSTDEKSENKDAKPLKRKRVSFSTEEVVIYSGKSSPSVKRMKLDEKVSEVGD